MTRTIVTMTATRSFALAALLSVVLGGVWLERKHRTPKHRIRAWRAP